MQGAAASRLPGLTPYSSSNGCGWQTALRSSGVSFERTASEKESLRCLMVIGNFKSFTAVTVVRIYGCVTCRSVYFFPQRDICMFEFFSKSSAILISLFNATVSYRCLTAVKLPILILA